MSITSLLTLSAFAAEPNGSSHARPDLRTERPSQAKQAQKLLVQAIFLHLVFAEMAQAATTEADSETDTDPDLPLDPAAEADQTEAPLPAEVAQPEAIQTEGATKTEDVAQAVRAPGDVPPSANTVPVDTAQGELAPPQEDLPEAPQTSVKRASNAFSSPQDTEFSRGPNTGLLFSGAQFETFGRSTSLVSSPQNPYFSESGTSIATGQQSLPWTANISPAVFPTTRVPAGVEQADTASSVRTQDDPAQRSAVSTPAAQLAGAAVLPDPSKLPTPAPIFLAGGAALPDPATLPAPTPISFAEAPALPDPATLPAPTPVPLAETPVLPDPATLPAPTPIVLAVEPPSVDTVTEPEPVLVAAPAPTPAPAEPEPVVVAEPAPPPAPPEPEPVVVAEPAPTPAPVEPEPVVVAEPEPTPAPAEPEPTPVSATLDAADQETPAETTQSGQTVGPGGTVMSGRVAIVDLGDANVQSIKILEQPDYGHVSVNPDMSLALVLTETRKTDPVDYTLEITYADGSTAVQTVTHDVTPGSQSKGWGGGNYYMLATDEDGDVVVEHGWKHREVYVSKSEDALSIADIAALEGIKVADVTDKFLAANREYGATEDMALDEDAAALLWSRISDGDRGTQSNWLLFERGYEYNEMNEIIPRGATGESALNPMMIGAWGTGAKPVLTKAVTASKESSANIVIQDIHFANGVNLLSDPSKILFDDVTVTGHEFNAQGVDGLTIHNSAIYGVSRDQTRGSSGDGEWGQSVDRISGLFVEGSENVLVQGTLFDQNGWASGYDYNLSLDYPQPPSFYNHNAYFQWNNSDVTYTDNINMRGSSYGAQFRSGAFIEDNLFLDNNAHVNFLGGDYKDKGHVGNYTLFHGNIITSAGYKTVAEKQGYLSHGVGNRGEDSTLKDNVIAHLANPDDPAELEEKYLNHGALEDDEQNVFYDDTIVHNWISGKHAAQGAKPAESAPDSYDETTIQRFTAALLEVDTATIEDLAAYLRALYDSEFPEHTLSTDDILAYFYEGFGIEIPEDPGTLHRFIPSDLGDGIRWDNRLNWAGEVEPENGDSVDLGGNFVRFNVTTTLENLTFGDYAMLDITSGKLTVTDKIDTSAETATIHIHEAGQLWINGFDDADGLKIEADGGRFANTGWVSGPVDMVIGGNAQAILAASDARFSLEQGSTLTLVGGKTKVGFDSDGEGPSILSLSDDSTLRFEAEDGAIGIIKEFFSGHYERVSNDKLVTSGVDLGGADLVVDATGLAEGSYVLVRADEIIGEFDLIDVVGLANTDATVVTDYVNDEVILHIGSGKSDKVFAYKMGLENDAENSPDVWNALQAAATRIPLDDMTL